MTKKIIKIIEVENCYDCPYYQVSGECSILNDLKKKPRFGVSEDCPLVDRKDYVAEGVTRNLEKVFGSLSSGGRNELEKTMA